MVPPPDNTGDEFPDFEKMSFEEQMAWLESLAKRQGAGDDELTTAADLDIPIPEGAEVDEPGYVPFEGSRSAREMQQRATSSLPEEELPPVPVERESFADEEIEEDVMEFVDEMVSGASDEGDPMQWLDSLAVQPAQDEDELDLFGEAVDLETDDELDLFDESGAEFIEYDEDVAEPDLIEAQAGYRDADEKQEAIISGDDPLGGMDPMLWLESLAARQGANLSELTTSADLEIGNVPEGAEIDEPGYVPFEGSRSAREAAQAARAAEERDRATEGQTFDIVDHEVEPEIASDLENLFAEIVDISDSVEVLPDLEGVADSDEAMEWLETLAKRQGARDEELLTSADLDVPEVPADTVVDEPGYIEYSPLSILPPEHPREVRDDVEDLAEMVAFDEESVDSGLSWLEDLAAEPDEDAAEFLAFEDEVVAHYAEDVAFDTAMESKPGTGVPGDPLAGMSDDDIARAQVQGTLTPQQELAWLKRQARALAETREMEQVVISEEEVPPAEPAEIPDWLETIRQTSEEEVLAVADEILDDSALDSGDLPDWLQEQSEDEVSIGEDDDFVEVSLDGDVESLWDDAVAKPEVPELDELIEDSELAAFVSGDFVPGEPDMLAEALDEEYERIQSGDDAEPEWYAAAVAKVAAEMPDSVELEQEQYEREEPALAAAEPIDAPGWLYDIAAEQEMEEETPVAHSVGVDEDMPEWLREVDEPVAASETVADVDDKMPDWLAGQADTLAAVTAQALPDWLSGFDEGEPAPEPVEPEMPAEAIPLAEKTTAHVVPDSKAPVTSPVMPADAQQYQERVERNPEDHPARLALARAFQSNKAVDSALNHYELLIESAQLLPDVAGDLIAMVEAQADHPRMQRLLGDAHMRRGMLAEALAAYRNALHQL